MKPALTIEQRKKFIKELKAIIAKAPEEIQKEFNKNSKIYFAIDDNPIIESAIQFRLPPKLKFEFNTLMNRLKSRTL
jgi:hypothetical protein